MSTKLISSASSATLQVNGQDALVFNKGGSTSKVQSITCTQGSGALTFGLEPCVLDFRSTTLTTGVPATRAINTALSLVLPSGGTLGAITTVQARLILLSIDNAGTPELAVVNLAGGISLDETGVISTTAIGTGSDSNNVIYSTTARAGVSYRVVGAIDVVNTAGAWGNPVLVQGMGGNALSAMSSLGYGQTWRTVTRTQSVTYYTFKPILLNIVATPTDLYAQFTVTSNGYTFNLTTCMVAGVSNQASIALPPGSYSWSITSGTVSGITVSELS